MDNPKLSTNTTKQSTARYDSASTFALEAYSRRDTVTGQSTTPASHWSGDVTLEEARDLGINGWPEGRDRAAKVAGTLVTQIADRISRQDWVPDVEGSHVDLGLYIAREPEYWLRPQEVFSEFGSSRRHVRILFNSTASCGITPETIEARGAAYAALVDLLELAGLGVTLDLVFSVNQRYDFSGRTQATFVTIKPANERGDIGRIMYWLGHPSTLRKLAFAYWEGCSAEVRQSFGFNKHGGYSYPADPALPSDEKQPDIYVSKASYGDPDWKDMQSTKAWIIKTLGALGVSVTA